MKILNVKSAIQNLMMTPLAIMTLALGVLIGGVAIVPSSTVNADCNVSNTSQVGLKDGAGCAQGTDTPSDLAGQNGIFKTVVNILLFIIGAVAVIMLIIGGLRYVTSNGDQNAVTGAKNTIMYAIIGIVVAFLAYAAVNFVITQLMVGSPATP